MLKTASYKISHKALTIFVLGLATFVAGFALHIFAAPEGVIDRYVASPLAAAGVGIFGGITWNQRKNFSLKARLAIMGVAMLFIFVWIVHAVVRA